MTPLHRLAYTFRRAGLSELAAYRLAVAQIVLISPPITVR